MDKGPPLHIGVRQHTITMWLREKGFLKHFIHLGMPVIGSRCCLQVPFSSQHSTLKTFTSRWSWGRGRGEEGRRNHVYNRAPRHPSEFQKVQGQVSFASLYMSHILNLYRLGEDFPTPGTDTAGDTPGILGVSHRWPQETWTHTGRTLSLSAPLTRLGRKPGLDPSRS